MKTLVEAADFIQLVGEQQKETPGRYCPRCGHMKMRPELVENALSRYADIYICPDCGMQEAMMSMSGRCLPLNEWKFVKLFFDDSVVADIESKEGFYIGDICYALKEEIYEGVWGSQNGYKDGCFTDPESSFEFAVAGTEHGDGCYTDNYGAAYPVDAGVIGLVPLELVKKSAIEDPDGTISRTPGIAHFEATNGHFEITLPDGFVHVIETGWEQVDDENDDIL